MNQNELFANRLKQAMKAKGYKAVDVVRKSSISKVVMSHYMSGRNRPTNRNLSELASLLDVAPEWLLGFRASNVTPIDDKWRQIDVIAYISCGNGEYNNGEVVDTFLLPAKLFNEHREYFAMYAKGNSMKDAGINDGDLLLFLRTNVPEQNKIGAFCIDNEYAYCKKYQSINGKIYLLSANEDYPPILIEPSDTCFRCVGVLKKILKDI